MWRDNLKELKKKTGMTTKQIAELSGLPESTVNRMFSGEMGMPLASNLYRVVKAMDGSLDDILSDTCMFVAPPDIIEAKKNVGIVEAERDLTLAENEMLKTKNAALTAENELLKKELQHKDELLAVFNYFIKTRPTE